MPARKSAFSVFSYFDHLVFTKKRSTQTANYCLLAQF